MFRRVSSNIKSILIKLIIFSEKNGLLHGLGHVYKKNEAYDGIFQKGILNGVGVFYNSKDNIYMYGGFSNNLCVDLIKNGQDYPFDITSILTKFISSL